MKSVLELIAEGVGDYTEHPCPDLTGEERFSDLGIDSLGIIMVTWHVAKGMELDLSHVDADDDQVEQLRRMDTASELVEYVGANFSSR